jgi:hypothetical protein
VQDETYLYCWNDSFIGTLPWKVSNNLRGISAYQVTENLCRVLIFEKLQFIYLLEVHRILFDAEKPDVFRGRLSEDHFKLDLSRFDSNKTTIITARLY